jgi:hypothetical protein
LFTIVKFVPHAIYCSFRVDWSRFMLKICIFGVRLTLYLTILRVFLCYFRQSRVSFEGHFLICDLFTWFICIQCSVWVFLLSFYRANPFLIDTYLKFMFIFLYQFRSLFILSLDEGFFFLCVIVLYLLKIQFGYFLLLWNCFRDLLLVSSPEIWNFIFVFGLGLYNFVLKGRVFFFELVFISLKFLLQLSFLSLIIVHDFDNGFLLFSNSFTESFFLIYFVKLLCFKVPKPFILRISCLNWG